MLEESSTDEASESVCAPAFVSTANNGDGTTKLNVKVSASPPRPGHGRGAFLSAAPPQPRAAAGCPRTQNLLRLFATTTAYELQRIARRCKCTARLQPGPGQRSQSTRHSGLLR